MHPPATHLPDIRATAVSLAVGMCLLGFAQAARADEFLHELERRYELLDGLILERYREPQFADPITIVRIDPAQFELQLLTEQRYGRRRRPEEWLEDFDLIGVINASMFQPNGRSTAMLLDDDLVNNDYEHPAYEGFFAFGARGDSAAPFVSIGRDCDGFDLAKLRRDYRFLLQNYRLLDCKAEPIRWRDRRRYSIAALGHDDHGWIVWVHGASGQTATGLAEWLGAPQLRLESAMFAEGGSQAVLLLDAGGRDFKLLGHHDLASQSARSRPLPNVLGIRQQP